MRQSQALHQRVRAFAKRWLPVAPPASFGHAEQALQSDFDALALEIARYQARWCAGQERLQRSAGSEIHSAADLPALPVDAFRYARVAVHPDSEDAARFSTSGTTGDAVGVHALGELSTYRELAVAFGRRALLGPMPLPVSVVALTAPFRPARESSLAFMNECFMEAFDGRRLDGRPGPWDPLEAGRWLVNADGIDVDRLRWASGIARARAEPLLLLGTALSLAALVEAMGGKQLPLPRGSTVMQTGGFKARKVRLSAEELVVAVARTLAIPERSIIGEYGMTELGSQLYEIRGCYRPPPWLRVSAVDPVSHARLRPGCVGLARFVDLANVDSALAILTQDQIVERKGGVLLLGRAPGAPPRGCSLGVEQLWQRPGADMVP